MDKKLKVSALFLVAATMLAGCGSKSASAGTHDYATKQSYNLMASTEVETMDPSLADDSTSLTQIENTNEGLYHPNKAGKLVAEAATKTKVSKDGMTYTFTIHKGMKWSNGDPVTAQNFVYGWQRSVNPKTKAPNAFLFAPIKNADAITAGKKNPKTLGVKAINKTTFKVTLVKPAPYLKQMTALPAFYPQDKKAVEKYGKSYGTSSTTTVYNGPFVQKGWTGSNLTWKLKKNKKYWDKKSVHLTTVNMQVVQNSSTALNLYQVKKLDDISLSGEQATQEKNNKDFYSTLANSMSYAVYNFKNKAMQNINIRKAISLVLNRKQVTSKVLADGSITPKGFVPSKLTENPKTGKDFATDAAVANSVTQNKKLAKKYWAKGMKQLGKTKLTINLMCWDEGSNSQVAEYMQSEINQTLKGADVKETTLPKKSAITKMSSHKGFDMALTGWSPDFLDLMDVLQLEQTGNPYNFGSFSNKSFDKDMKAAITTDATNSQARYDDYVKAEKILMKQQGVAMIDQGASTFLHNPKVKDAATTTDGGTFLKGAYVVK